ncbi:MAG: hypothetical protein ACYCSN_11015, partial [Acidobacteriaceae bacterium]
MTLPSERVVVFAAWVGYRATRDRFVLALARSSAVACPFACHSAAKRRFSVGKQGYLSQFQQKASLRIGVAGVGVFGLTLRL